jgi:hypothetical protein
MHPEQRIALPSPSTEYAGIWPGNRGGGTYLRLLPDLRLVPAGASDSGIYAAGWWIGVRLRGECLLRLMGQRADLRRGQEDIPL